VLVSIYHKQKKHHSIYVIYNNYHNHSISLSIESDVWSGLYNKGNGIYQTKCTYKTLLLLSDA